eukprot:TRINITY_DN14399_c0_g1_i1.p1 TRINITY_DN14399_c0_g1~~TRINITY_DN14399_c0_g1_i1.p1  ORF type:complete len:219 (+),score=54.33 TRINITY_DN14399_c0_g1_i1:287-943(+)
MDGIMEQSVANSIQTELLAMHASAQLIPGEVRGGKEARIRGDLMKWIDYPDAQPAMQSFMQAVDELVLELPDHVEELDGNGRMLMRASAMVTVYPGNGAHYVRHIDNNNGNGRVLTTILYLNPHWQPSHNGCLRLYLKAGTVEIEPLFNRLVIFWSDSRCPHEVLPAHSLRYAMSIWYLDTQEAMDDLQNDKEHPAESEEEETARAQRLDKICEQFNV